MFLSRVEEHIFLPKRTKVQDLTKYFPGMLPPHPSPCFLSPSIFDALPPLAT